MMYSNRSYLSLTIILLIFLSTCEKNPTNHTFNPLVQEIQEQIIIPQELNANLFTTLTTSMDTLAAMDSVLNVFLQDSLVEWGEVSSQGIAIQYKNGIRGGIYIDPLDFPEIDDENFKHNYISNVQSENNLNKNVIPSSKKTIFLNPSYWERKKWADPLINNYNLNLSKVQFENPDVYTNEQATLDIFTKLSGYGIVHIYSHGWSWPKKENIQEVYLLTGQEYSQLIVNNFLEDCQNKDILITHSTKSKKNKLWISPNFIAKYNDFSADTSLVYGGFCYSNLGSWPTTIIETTKAGGYFGFDWSVWTSKNAKWNFELIKSITDTSNGQANSTVDWFTNSFPKYYYDNHFSHRNVNIVYTGNPELALIENDETESIFTTCEVYLKIRGQIRETVDYINPNYTDKDTIRWGYYSRDFVDDYSGGNFTGNTFTYEYVKEFADGKKKDIHFSLTLADDLSKILNISYTNLSTTNTSTLNENYILENIPLTQIDQNNNTATYSLNGVETCNSISTISWTSLYEVISLSQNSRSLNNYQCDQDSYIIVTLE